MEANQKRSFSERFGFKTVNQRLLIDSMSTELKNSLWNVLHEAFLDGYIKKDLPLYDTYHNKDIENFFRLFWRDHLKNPVDDFLNELYFDKQKEIVSKFRHLYFNEFQWYEVYDFVEALLTFFCCKQLNEQINFILRRELSAWRFVGNCFTQITSEQEILMIEEALNDDQFQSVSSHLAQALQLMSDKQNPDYRNSIKESISAVESLARIITNDPKVILGKALGKIEQSGKLHNSLKASFSALYGYTSDEHGIRHSMLEEPNLTIDDAKFFFLSCTSFTNYLKTKM